MNPDDLKENSSEAECVGREFSRNRDDLEENSSEAE